MNDQSSLELKQEGKLKSVEEYKFEPIKGYPMLHWKGKRPFESTQFYPAQLKESYGKDEQGWMNKIFWGDNLQVMSHLLKDYRGKIDLIYIDPPFDSKADYKKKISVRGNDIKSDTNSFEEKQYTDIWSNDEFLQFIYDRLTLMRELLKPNGAIFVHLDYRKNHHIRCIMDEIFGEANFVNEIIWHYFIGASPKDSFGRKHNNILYYVKSKDGKEFNRYEIGVEYNPETIARAKRGEARYNQNVSELEKKGKNPGDVWKDCDFTIDDYVWSDLHPIQGNAIEKVNYPTQKPESLLERIIKAASKPGDIVFDCFMGSGTSQAVALKNGRRFIGADINLGSIDTTIQRLLKCVDNIETNNFSLNFTNNEGDENKVDVFYTGFEVYNVNNYDVFRNPVEARDILVQALEIQPLPTNTIYDGEKDGRMVKIMPVNRIATKADLNDLISGFNQKEFQKKFDEAPNKPVEKLLLVCMGHEPDLAASLQKEMNPFKIDVEVVDILRDKSNLEFKRDSEASIKTDGDTLIIEEYYPMNLLQKLSLMKENIEDWKELTESVKIDYNYDGVVFEPTVVDIPEKDKMVKGSYPIPEGTGTIRVKITDLLSESLEVTLER